MQRPGAILLGLLCATSMSSVAVGAHAEDQPPDRPRLPPIAQTALMLDLSVGPAYSSTIDMALVAGAGVHARYEFLQLGVTGSLATGANGTYSAAGLELGPVLRDFAGMDVGLFALGGRRKYGDVGAVAATHTLFGCSGMSGVDGTSSYVGARLDLHRTLRTPRSSADMVGPMGLLGASIYYQQDLTSQHFANDGAITCSGLFSSSVTPRHIEGNLGGYELGVAFRFGFGAGF